MKDKWRIYIINLFLLCHLIIAIYASVSHRWYHGLVYLLMILFVNGTTSFAINSILGNRITIIRWIEITKSAFLLLAGYYLILMSQIFN